MPLLTVFAGPNGSGKSSLIRRVDFEGRLNLLEPDAVAIRMNPEFPHRAGIPAGREVLRRTAEYIRQEESFAIETTLAGCWTDTVIKTARERSFFPRRRRYGRSLAHAGPLLQIVDQGLVFDNLGAEPKLVFEMRQAKVLNAANEMPTWADILLQSNRSRG